MPRKDQGADFTTSFAEARAKKKNYVSAAEYLRQQKLFSALEKTSQFLALETDINLILSRIAKTLCGALGAKYVNFWNFTLDKKGLYISAAAGMSKAYIKHSKENPIALGTAWVGRVVQTGTPWATSDVQKDPKLPSTWLPVVKKQNYHGVLCLPLIRKNEIIGGMCIYYKDTHEFGYFEMSLANIVANQAATAASNAVLFNDLLTEKNKTFATIQSLKEGLIMYDLDGKVVLFNSRAEEILWLKAKDVVGQTINEGIKKDAYWENLYNIKNLVQEEYAYKEYSTTGPQKLILEVTNIPVRSQYVKIGYLNILRDITKEKEIELLKSRFVSVASHQLRTPLTAVKWSLDSLLKEELGSINEKQKQLMAKVYKTNDYLIKLVNDLLDMSQIEEGKFGYDFKLGNIEDLVLKIFEDFKINAQKRSIIFEMEKSDEILPEISFDAEKLGIAIRNIIDNSIKYTLPGGSVKISLRLGEGKRSLLLLIEDSGIGIPQEDQKFIFVKFFRARNAIKLETNGSGLGLYITKEIIEKHNGAILYESKENKGSTFILQFPLDSDKMPKSLSIE
ncbi:MAG: ATP-binding protein [bacterium]|nr:ATP-binding protein [bacterium]